MENELKISLRLDHQNIYFISDLHLFHNNVIKFDNRPYENIVEMNNSLIENWNNVVSDDDYVFYLGDLSFGSFNKTKDIVSNLKGNIYFILGNHDRLSDIKKIGKFKGVFSYLELYIKDDTSIDSNGDCQHIILSHYPCLQWNRKHHRSFHLHGHSHQMLSNDISYKWYYEQYVLDVSCNGINYAPISYSEVKEIMLTKKVSY